MRDVLSRINCIKIRDLRFYQWTSIFKGRR